MKAKVVTTELMSIIMKWFLTTVKIITKYIPLKITSMKILIFIMKQMFHCLLWDELVCKTKILNMPEKYY